MVINVTKTFLPPMEEYNEYLQGIWERAYVTNRGPLVLELENKLKKYLGVKHLLFVSNGTIALQIAIKALELKGEIITTPFSYVATTTAILWENCTPVFVDINEMNFCIDTSKIEASITDKTVAILATHVYGYPCDVVEIERIALKHNLRVIYDGAHAFGMNVNEQSVFNFGDVSTLSFHATKLFHTIEGGAIITNNDALAEKIMLMHQFGHMYENYVLSGINGKNSEFHAAMGLCLFHKVDDFIYKRNLLVSHYDKYLQDLNLIRPVLSKGVEYNGSYYPLIFESESQLLYIKEALSLQDVNTRRYFYPSLNTLNYVSSSVMPVSESIAKRVLCLPLFYELSIEQVDFIVGIIREAYANYRG